MSFDAVERVILNELQGGFPVCDQPFHETAGRLGLREEELIGGIDKLLENGVLTRFGPLYHAEEMGGGLTLAAMHIPANDFERVAGIVNAFPEVAHNYERNHKYNMWFVVATETPERIEEVLEEIQRVSGYPVLNMPKEQEFFIGLRFDV